MDNTVICNEPQEVIKAVRSKKKLVLAPTLTFLNLAQTTLGDEGACALSDSLKSNTTLTTLHHLGNSIGAEGADFWDNVDNISDHIDLIRLEIHINKGL